MDKIKITNHQLFSLTANCSIGGSAIVISAALTSIAKQDAWMGVFITFIFGIPIICTYCFLGRQYPDMTLIEIIKKIFGKWFGLLVAASFVFFCFTTTSRVTWYIGNFLTTQVMPETPSDVINLFFLATIVIALLYGIETIARASEIFIYVASISLFTAMILVLPNVRIENIQPLFEKGIIPIFKSSIFLSSILVFPLITLLMIYPVNIYNPKKASGAVSKGFLWSCLLMFIVIIMSILVLGSAITSRLQYPVYILAKEIDVGIIFTRIEFIITASWIVTQFIAATLYFYACVVGLSQLLGLNSYKRLVIPLGLIVFVMTGVYYPNVIYETNWVSLVWIPYSTTYGMLLPVALVIIFYMKKWIKKVNI